jgi:hypothetical protein
VTLSVLIERAERGWTAEVLEHDLATQFDRREDAGAAVSELLAGHLAICEHAGVSPWYMPRAPALTWRKFLCGVAVSLDVGTCTVDGRLLDLPRVDARLSRGLPRRRAR